MCYSYPCARAALCVKCIASGPLVTHQISAQSIQPLPRYRKRCAQGYRFIYFWVGPRPSSPEFAPPPPNVALGPQSRYFLSPRKYTFRLPCTLLSVFYAKKFNSTSKEGGLQKMSTKRVMKFLMKAPCCSLGTGSAPKSI